jgi:hypothetical protein
LNKIIILNKIDGRGVEQDRVEIEQDQTRVEQDPVVVVSPGLRAVGETLMFNPAVVACGTAPRRPARMG